SERNAPHGLHAPMGDWVGREHAPPVLTTWTTGDIGTRHDTPGTGGRNMTTSPSGGRFVFKDLVASLAGQLVLPEDATYERVRQLWNGGVRTRPAAIVRCANAQDVVHTVRWARSRGLALSVRGGGHDFAGRALCEDGVVIDCSQMRAVAVD